MTTITARIDRGLWNEIIGKQWYGNPTPAIIVDEPTPRFEQWASAVPSQIAVTYDDPDIAFSYHHDERTAVVLTNASMLDKTIDKKFKFAGIVRTSFNCPADTGAYGPSGDEYFTLYIGGKVQLLNNSGEDLKVGDSVGWTFEPQREAPVIGIKRVRDDLGPRQIRLKKVNFTDPSRFGKVTNVISKRGGMVDILLQAATL